MKKLALALDELQVESFSTIDGSGAPNRTVHGYISLMTCSCVECATLSGCETGCGGATHGAETCEENPTCLPTCAGWTCNFDTCGDCHTSNIC